MPDRHRLMKGVSVVDRFRDSGLHVIARLVREGATGSALGARDGRLVRLIASSAPATAPVKGSGRAGGQARLHMSGSRDSGCNLGPVEDWSRSRRPVSSTVTSQHSAVVIDATGRVRARRSGAPVGAGPRSRIGAPAAPPPNV
jgi:hypothetical protein